MNLTAILIYFLLVVLVAICVSGIFWLINKFPEPYRLWITIVVAGILIILLLVFIINIVQGNINFNNPIRLR
jgi:O-antigen/teichoic acid export membrane protein